ncbi:hypothetical protein [Actinomadura rudentiformis]|nr:hypothetical protein [Actinomadura rudentiformis]
MIRKRPLLVLYALGTNVGIKRVADGGRHGDTGAPCDPSAPGAGLGAGTM